MTSGAAVRAIVAHARANPERTPMAMPVSEPWTLEQLDRLPDDGNRYEVLDGELLVTPAPTDVHEELVALLVRALVPFVETNRVGRVYTRGVVQHEESRLEPDILVRSVGALRGWKDAPLPILVVEVLSRSTWHRDLEKKRDFYTRIGIPEYWIVDREDAVVLQIRGNEARRVSTVLQWASAGVSEILEIDVAALFADIASRT